MVHIVMHKVWGGGETNAEWSVFQLPLLCAVVWADWGCNHRQNTILHSLNAQIYRIDWIHYTDNVSTIRSQCRINIHIYRMTIWMHSHEMRHHPSIQQQQEHRPIRLAQPVDLLRHDAVFNFANLFCCLLLGLEEGWWAGNVDLCSPAHTHSPTHIISANTNECMSCTYVDVWVVCDCGTWWYALSARLRNWMTDTAVNHSLNTHTHMTKGLEGTAKAAAATSAAMINVSTCAHANRDMDLYSLLCWVRQFFCSADVLRDPNCAQILTLVTAS